MNRIDAQAIREEVAAFYAQHAVGSQAADAFAAWWLTRRWRVESLVATAHAPAGASDKGLDGFFLEHKAGGESPVLHLIQAKFSSDHAQIRRAVREFAPTCELLASVLRGDPLPTRHTNSIWQRLHATIARLREHSPAAIDTMAIRFEILHLSDAASETLIGIVRSSSETFNNAKLDNLPSYEVGIRPIYPPSELDPVEEIQPKLLPHGLRFSGEVVSDSDNVRFFAGVGYLSDLVKLYDTFGEALFSKNVRSYLYKSHDKGPARYMRDSLSRACIATKGGFRDSPERFAMLHNGVALVAVNAQSTAGNLALFSPNVINGCQTVKNAALWLADRQDKPGFSRENWERVRIPIRVLITHDEDLVSDVTISNNRQNAIRPSAFRANHHVQLQLAERFREQCAIFYERQEGAFQNLQRTNPRLLEDAYGNSQSKPLRMEELAVAIAVASLRPALSVASKPSELFEDSVYNVVFAEYKTANLALLVFLRNLLAVLPLVIKDIAATDSAYEKISQAKYAYPCHRVLARYIMYYQPGLVKEYGAKVLHRFPVDEGLRKKARTLMTSGAHTGLKTRLKQWFLEEGGTWKSATDAQAIDAILHELDLHEVDAFQTYAEALVPLAKGT